MRKYPSIKNVIGRRLLALASLCALAGGGVLTSSGFLKASHAAPPDGGEKSGPEKFLGAEFVPGEILVRFRDGEAAGGGGKREQSSQVLSAGGREIVASMEKFDGPELVGGLHLARVRPEETTVALEAFRSRPDVLYAEPNFIRRPLRAPNDPRYPAQWALRNPSAFGHDIAAEAAWDTTTGDRAVVVGVIDTGIDINHGDLRANIWRNPAEAAGAAGVDDDGNGFVDDVNGWDFRHDDATVYDGPGVDPDGSPVDSHGTHVAGIIGAHGDNGVGVAGVNWQTSILPLKFIGPEGGRTSDLLRAYAYAKMMRERGVNLRVLNNSYGGFGRSQAELDAINALAGAGILFVAAAGNGAADGDRYPQYPASYRAPNLISVAASASDQNISRLSNYGARSVHLYAPGHGILSTAPGNGYSTLSGTSMAAAFVTGAAALVAAAHPSLPSARARAALLYGGREFNPGWPTITGRHLSAAGALQNAAATDAVAPGAVGQFRIDQAATPAGDPLRRKLLWAAPGDDGASGRASAYEIRFSEVDLGGAAEFERARPLIAPLPRAAGAAEEQLVALPYRVPSGFVGIRAVDEAGNAGPVSAIEVSTPVEVADPYLVTQTESDPSQFVSGGVGLGLKSDERYLTDYALPFRFTYFNTVVERVTVSVNGVLYMGGNPPRDTAGNPADVPSVAERLAATPRIAALWDDLRTDRREGDDVFVSQPDPDRVVFRWQAVTYDTPLPDGTRRGERPANFEIELHRDGTIILRYREGNERVFPVVGLSGGEPEPYLVASHTSDFTTGLHKDLYFAQTVTFKRRVPVPLPTTDVGVSMSHEPSPAAAGQQVFVSVKAHNYSATTTAERPSAAVVLPAGLRYVSCVPLPTSVCAGTAGASGTVVINYASLPPRFLHGLEAKVIAEVSEGAAGPLVVEASISSNRADPESSNNTAGTVVDVAESVTFGGVKAVAAGARHSLALKTDGTVWAWGLNTSGQLGIGASTATNASPAPVSGLTGVAAIEAGDAHSLALKTDGTVWAWGSNEYGQLGINNAGVASRNAPAQVSGLSGVVAVSTCANHNLALKADGTVWGWGANFFNGAAGSATNSIHVYSPVQVPNLSNVSGVAAGNGISFVVKTDGTVLGWGPNNWGQAGGPSGMPIPAPTAVAGIDNVERVTAGGMTAYALKRDGTVWSWGYGANGERGDGTTQSVGAGPRAVVNLAGVAAADGGSINAFALKSDGTLWAWGYNYSGALGDGTQVSRLTPVRVPNLGRVVAFSASGEHTMAVLADGTVRVWGRNDDGQVGDRSTVSRLVAGPPLASPAVTTAPTFSPAAGTYSASQQVTISNGVPGTIIRYTTDGSDPGINSPVLSGPLPVGRSLTVKARAWRDGQGESPVVDASYRIEPATGAWLRFDAFQFTADEKAGSVEVRVRRTGDPNLAVSVGFRTEDLTNADVRCDASQGFAALARCDYGSTVDTLHFAPGETLKTISIPVIDDGHDEGVENFGVVIHDAVNAGFDNPTNATVTITGGGESADAPNPTRSNRFFVRQHYLDFLSREPEPSGFDAWVGLLDRCPDVANDPECGRVTVSGSFFRSAEFELKGYSVYRFYRATLGRIPTYAEIVADMRKVTGQTAEETHAKRDAFAAAWPTRPDFRAAYDGLSHAGFAYALMRAAGVESAGGVTRDALVADLRAGRRSRAEAVRLVVESPEVDAREYHGAFVAMQYYGYLRRTPEQSGYEAWLRVIKQDPNNIRVMVNGFVNSQEYVLRFGRP